MRLFNRVSVWLDELAPRAGSFAHAVEWAAHSRTPVRALASTQAWSIKGNDELQSTLRACEACCENKGVAFQSCIRDETLRRCVQELFGPSELCMLGRSLPEGQKKALVHRARLVPQNAVMFCPRFWQPVTKLLIVLPNTEPDTRFLDSVAWLCQAFDTTPILLSVAFSEREAWSRQQSAKEMFTRSGVPAHFDLLAGEKLPKAIGLVARWRACTHVAIYGNDNVSWWNRIHGGLFQDLLGLSDLLTLLKLPVRQRIQPISKSLISEPGQPVSTPG
jgi:hypothetical protein